MCNFQEGKTALSIAVEKGHTEIIVLLRTSRSKVSCTLDYKMHGTSFIMCASGTVDLHVVHLDEKIGSCFSYTIKSITLEVRATKDIHV